MFVIAHLAMQIALVFRVLLRRHREPAARIAWIVVILSLPVLGIMAYLLLGETNVGRRRVERRTKLRHSMPVFAEIPGANAALQAASEHERHVALFKMGRSISGFAPVGGNRATLMADTTATIAAMVADIDAATDHVHILFYIWLPDGNGRQIAEAVMRAARRGVTVRVMVDDLGSRAMWKHPLWGEMGDAGVRQARALMVGNPLWRAITGRIDLRNHRKIVVIDSGITYCGSQNCADAAFLPKAKYGPWVDAVMRFEGPIARQNQLLFAADWMAEEDEDLLELLMQPLPAVAGGFTAQVIAEGPTDRPSAAPEMFAGLIYAARREVIVTTPYYVPVDSLQSALRAAANRGVEVALIVPARNDDFAVGAAARSYFEDLISAGVLIFEYHPGLLHTKSITVDAEMTLIGSANMDCRSFALNFENNILLCDAEATAAMRQRQMEYMRDSTRLTAEAVQAWPWYRRLWNNALAVVGPVL